MVKLILFIFLIITVISCSKVVVAKKAVDLKYATIFLDTNNSVPPLSTLNGWPTDTLRNRILTEMGSAFSKKFYSEINHSVRKCRYSIVESKQLSDVVIELKFPKVKYENDTLFLTSQINIGDRRSGKKESFSYVTVVVKNWGSKIGDPDLKFHEYGELINLAIKEFNTEEMVGALCPAIASQK